MRRIYPVVFLLLVAHFLQAQIGGISASKINSFNHSSLDFGKSEFEPSYNFLTHDKFWTKDGQLVDAFLSPDSLEVQASWNLRMVYVLVDGLEVGSILGSDFSNWSVKYSIATLDKLGFGAMAGVNLPFGNALIDRSARNADEIGSYGFGLIASYEFTEKSSIDFNVQRMDNFYTHAELPNSDWFWMVDYGHYINDFLLAGSLIYQNSNFDLEDQNKLTLSYAVSIEMNPQYALVFNMNHDLWGRSVVKTNGFSVAFTITL